MISRRDMLKRSGTALAALAAVPGAWRRLAVEDAKLDQAAGPEPAGYVDPFIGTSGHGHTYPGVQVPFGMVQLSPDNGVSGWDWSSGYHWSSRRIKGFSHTHLSGTGIGDMYDVLVMPALTSGPPLRDYSSGFSHERERAGPGYYSIELPTSGITAELTATERVGVHRYAFPQSAGGSRPTVVVDLGHTLNWDRPTNTLIRVESPTFISGHRMSAGWAPDQRLYFAAAFSRPFRSYWLESEWAEPATRTELEGERVKGGFQFLPGRRVVAKVALSPVSVEAAKRNLQAEVPGWDFDAARADAVAAWNRALSRVRVTTPNPDERTLLYTSLYHAMLAPQLFCDVDGAYRGPDAEVHRTDGFANYTVFSLWDTFRAEHPLLTLLQPERVDDLMHSMMAFYREHGLLPVWSLAGNETNTMIGYHSVPVLLDAITKRLTTVDPQEALEAMIRSATRDGEGLRYYRMPGTRPLAEVRQERMGTSLRRVGQIEQSDLDRLGALVSGYERSLGGDTLRYHSPYPNARRALIVRSEDGEKSIEWETAPVPEEAAGRKISFIWLAGIDAGENRRLFELSVNGEPWISFRAPRVKDRRFSRSGPGGSRLTFKATHTDQYDDQFGFMFLTLPAGLAAGERLKLRMKGEAAGTRDWYMAFEHSMAYRLIPDNVYALVEEAGERRQVVRVDVEYLGPPTPAVIKLGDAPPVATDIAFGQNRVVLTAPVVDRVTPLPVALIVNDVTALETELELRPVRPFGYIPADWERESVSKTLEYAYDDWCIARLAESLGRRLDAQDFYARAAYYRNVFDRSSGFMRGRLSDGSWREPFSPTAASQRQDEFTEGNAWQYSWFAPHDVQGLIDLMGGREAFIAKLDELFEHSSDMEGAPPDITGMIGQYAHGNEPSHHIAYLYCYAGAPWKTQERVRWITDRLYGTGPDGLPGNEDCGQMSAWYILSAIGFYPVNPAEGIYVIGTPHYERVALDVGDGKTFVVEAPGTSSANKYVQSATLNGEPLTRCYITHAEIVAGGTLAFVMGDTPNESWAADRSAAPPSMTPA